MYYLKFCKTSKVAAIAHKDTWVDPVDEFQHIHRSTRFIVITGAHNSGKSRVLESLYDRAEDIWKVAVRPYAPTKSTSLPRDKPVFKTKEEYESWKWPDPVMVCCIDPLSKWATQLPFDTEGLPAWKKVEMVADYLKRTRAVLFVDDAHKATARKARLITQYLLSAYRAVITCEDEALLPPTVREIIMKSGSVDYIRLKSDVAYDTTGLLVWLLVAGLFAAGMTEAAMFLGLLQALGRGRRATRQN